MKKIKTFKEIALHKNSLIILDIDDTTLKYNKINKQWWTDTFNKYYKIHNDYELADEQSNLEWITYIQNTMPLHTDNIGIKYLFDECDKLNCSVIFLTARNSELHEITIKHLQIIGINDVPIYFTNGQNKGHMLKNILNCKYKHAEKIIFVDDLEENIIDVKNEIQQTECYLFAY